MIHPESLTTPPGGVKTVPTAAQRAMAVAWFAALRDRICTAFEALEDEYAATRSEPAPSPPGRFTRTSWRRAPDPDQPDTGGGTMAVMKGQVFEKVGVNISEVYGTFSPAMRAQMPGAQAAEGSDGRFWAAGISLVAHMANPHVPAVHMNTRHICTTHGWFGGGADLTPALPRAEDTAAFHAALKAACDAAHPAYHARYKPWCDEYFFIPHRHEPRGVGGIFYDYHDSGDWQADFAFTQNVGRAFLDVFPQLVRRRMHEPFTAADHAALLQKRGRYAEFNLVYDRGTKFGLMTGGHTEAILMSLPPLASWA